MLSVPAAEAALPSSSLARLTPCGLVASILLRGPGSKAPRSGDFEPGPRSRMEATSPQGVKRARELEASAAASAAGTESMTAPSTAGEPEQHGEDLTNTDNRKKVIKLRSARALKLGCTTAVYHHEGKRVAAGGEDGSLHLIQLDRPHVKHDVVREAHPGCWLTSVSFNDDGHLLATRAMDDTVKLWDIRKLGGGVVKTFADVPTHLETANTSFSTDGRVLVCGSNVPPKTNATGVLKFFDVYTSETSPELEVNAAPDASVGRVVWHPQTNQIICSTSAGGVRVMYDPAISDKGAMLSAGRSHSRLNTNMFLPKHAVGEVYAPHALPMYREEQNSKKRKERSDRKDPVRSKKPDPPMPGRGVQGRISSSNNFHQYVLKEHLVSQKNLLHEDPREELLKYDEETKKDKEFLGSAYEQSQPKGGGMFHRTLEEEEEDFKDAQRKLLDT